VKAVGGIPSVYGLAKYCSGLQLTLHNSHLFSYNILTTGAISLLLHPPEQCCRLVWALHSTALVAGTAGVFSCAD